MHRPRLRYVHEIEFLLLLPLFLRTRARHEVRLEDEDPWPLEPLRPVHGTQRHTLLPEENLLHDGEEAVQVAHSIHVREHLEDVRVITQRVAHPEHACFLVPGLFRLEPLPRCRHEAGQGNVPLRHVVGEQHSSDVVGDELSHPIAFDLEGHPRVDEVSSEGEKRTVVATEHCIRWSEVCHLPLVQAGHTPLPRTRTALDVGDEALDMLDDCIVAAIADVEGVVHQAESLLQGFNRARVRPAETVDCLPWVADAEEPVTSHLRQHLDLDGREVLTLIHEDVGDAVEHPPLVDGEPELVVEVDDALLQCEVSRMRETRVCSVDDSTLGVRVADGKAHVLDEVVPGNVSALEWSRLCQPDEALHRLLVEAFFELDAKLAHDAAGLKPLELDAREVTHAGAMAQGIERLRGAAEDARAVEPLLHPVRNDFVEGEDEHARLAFELRHRALHRRRLPTPCERVGEEVILGIQDAVDECLLILIELHCSHSG